MAADNLFSQARAFYSTSSDALSFLSTIGLTSLKILLYVIIEIDQRHKQAAA